MRKYLLETSVILAIASAVFFKGTQGVIAFGLSLSILVAIIAIELVREKKNPSLDKLEKDVADLKTITEQLTLRLKR